MHQDRENLDIIFRKRTPEDVLGEIRNLYNGKFKETRPYEIGSFEWYDYYGKDELKGYSGDEIHMRFKQMQKQWKDSGDSVFGLLHQYGDRVLLYKNHEPLCKIDEILGWNSITARLGQDLIVTSWLAHGDVRKSGTSTCTQSFDWPYCIRTDDLRLNKMLENGLAENHFHLGGSSQSFALSWAALMNHPKTIYKTLRESQRFERNLEDAKTDISITNEERWTKWLRYAAFIRALLFERCIGVSEESGVKKDFMAYDRFQNHDSIIYAVDCLRMFYGAKVCKTPKGRCLDYVMSTKLYALKAESYNRLLSAERAFLYECFTRIYRNKFTNFEKSIFYLYLLIKSNFRGELIQTNQRNGFHNFQQYQNRKRQFYRIPEYIAEAQRLAVCSTIQENHIVSLEARIMPEKSAGKMAGYISNNDLLIKKSSKEDCSKVFYVTHFAKSPFTEKEVKQTGMFVLRPRNWKLRNLIYKQARAIYFFRHNYQSVRGEDGNSLQARLRGIDACSSEIGCRPETFATEFRFLRGSNRYSEGSRYWTRCSEKGDLGITYHVGEDFLDICDGLRAVDEAIEFLELNNADRIGHGMVMGIDPQSYYKSRFRHVYLTKQDYLDNCIWLLFRTLEWGIHLETSARERLRQRAYQLIDEIYGGGSAGRSMNDLEAFYRSWHLRGDHPDLYRSGKYLDNYLHEAYPYHSYCTRNKNESFYRKDDEIANLYYRYQFDKNVKLKGLEVVPIEIKPWYENLMKEMQEYMRCNIIAKKGIAIECNPTSNRLIGYFTNYDQHPILEFCDYKLDPDSTHSQIMVSVNTDDLGVFDTSLSYEYALLLSAIRRQRHKSQNYNDEQIYEYLEHIRQNGFKIRFDKKGNDFV